MIFTIAAVAGIGASFAIIFRLNWLGSDFSKLASYNAYAIAAFWVFTAAFLILMIAGGMNGSIQAKRGKYIAAISIGIAAVLVIAIRFVSSAAENISVRVFSLSVPVIFGIFVIVMSSFFINVTGARGTITRKNRPKTQDFIVELESLIVAIFIIVLMVAAAFWGSPMSYCGNSMFFKSSGDIVQDLGLVCFITFLSCAPLVIAVFLWADANSKSFMHALKILFIVALVLLGLSANDIRRCAGIGFIIIPASIGIIAAFYKFAENKGINLLCFLLVTAFIGMVAYAVETGTILQTEGFWAGVTLICGVAVAAHYLAVNYSGIPISALLMVISVIAFAVWAVLSNGNARIITGHPYISDVIICFSLLSSGISLAIMLFIKRKYRVYRLLSVMVLVGYVVLFFIPLLTGNPEFWREFFSFMYLLEIKEFSGQDGYGLAVWG